MLYLYLLRNIPISIFCGEIRTTEVKTELLEVYGCVYISGSNSLRCTFHQHLTYQFLYKCRFGSFYYVHVTEKSCQNNVRLKNLYVKMLMKLTPVGFKRGLEWDKPYQIEKGLKIYLFILHLLYGYAL